MSLPQSRFASYFRTRMGPFAMVLVIAAGQAFIANAVGVITGTLVWILPALTFALLLVSIFVYPEKRENLSKHARCLSIGMVLYLTAVNVLCMAWFVYDMYNPQTITIAHELLLAGGTLWIMNVGIFALAYWELDGGGPEMRSTGAPSVLRGKVYPDFVFPQQMNNDERLNSKDWSPGFVDYLYLSSTSATSFAASVPAPYTGIAKILVGSETLISFLTIGLIISRAIGL